ncbi:MAG TPA: sulfurtransferase [Candidatus Nitrosotalea sp.]|nr:sulfurtransferase [Candidatus Nitrosotalea sp.]
MSDQYANAQALVSTEWVASHLGDDSIRLIEVDVNPDLYAAGHIPGATGWDWHRDLQDPVMRDLASREALATKLGEAGVGPTTTVLLYGDSNNWFAAYAYWALRYYGLDQVKLVNGGRVKWEAEGRAYSSEQPSVAATSFQFPNPVRDQLRAFRDQVKEQIGRSALVDVRSPGEFSGELLAPENLPQEGAQRGGHIPTAANIPWAQAVREDGTFKTAEELRGLYGGKGVGPDRPVIAYCRIGERSAHTWFVLSELLGYPDVRNYDGSWTEWGSSVGVPIEK